jgi:hypothetical protein
MATTADLLADAQAAYHRLMTGESVVRVRDQNGEQVMYDSINANKLAAYILSLQMQLGQISRCDTGPMRPWF